MCIELVDRAAIAGVSQSIRRLAPDVPISLKLLRAGRVVELSTTLGEQQTR